MRAKSDSTDPLPKIILGFGASLFFCVLAFRAIPSIAATTLPDTDVSTFADVLRVTITPGLGKNASSAQVQVADPEPQLTPIPTQSPIDPRIERIEAVFAQHGSPMTGLGELIVTTADKYNTDPYLIVAISGQESSFGKYRCGYNVWGYASCAVRFNSWEHAIDKEASLLAGHLYNARNDTNWSVAQVGRVYAEDPHWHKGVSYFYNMLHSR